MTSTTSSTSPTSITIGSAAVVATSTTTMIPPTSITTVFAAVATISMFDFLKQPKLVKCTGIFIASLCNVHLLSQVRYDPAIHYNITSAC